MASPLASVKRAAVDAERAQAALRQSIVAAVEAGERVAAVAEQAGLTRQRVYQIIRAEGLDVNEGRMRARLAELDARYEALVDRVAELYKPPEDFRKRDQLYRNMVNGKLEKAKGSSAGYVGRYRGSRKLPTVGAEVRSFAESQILRRLADGPDDPLVERIVAEIDEAEALRLRVQALADRRDGIL